MKYRSVTRQIEPPCGLKDHRAAIGDGLILCADCGSGTTVQLRKESGLFGRTGLR